MMFLFNNYNGYLYFLNNDVFCSITHGPNAFFNVLYHTWTKCIL